MTALRQSIEAEAKQTPTKPKAAAPKGKAAKSNPSKGSPREAGAKARRAEEGGLRQGPPESERLSSGAFASLRLLLLLRVGAD
jgi:hypothetical protein